jgi:hypothetical protein
MLIAFSKTDSTELLKYTAEAPQTTHFHLESEYYLYSMLDLLTMAHGVKNDH